MTTLERLRNIQPGQQIMYWEKCPIYKGGYTGIELRNAARRMWLADRVLLVQKKVKHNAARCSKEHDTGEFEYYAIGKVTPPCLKTIAMRARHERVLNNQMELRSDDAE